MSMTICFLALPEHQDLNELLQNIVDEGGSCQQALDFLIGKKEGLPQYSHLNDFEVFGALITEFIGEIESLNNRMKQEERADSLLPKESWESWYKTLEKGGWLKELPKVPALNGGIPDFHQEIEEMFAKYQTLQAHYQQQCDQLTKKSNWSAILNACEISERRTLEKVAKKTNTMFSRLILHPWRFGDCSVYTSAKSKN